MRDGGPNTLYTSGAAGWFVRVASWLGDDVLSDDIPVLTGHLTCDVTQQVPERLTLTVPRTSIVEGKQLDWRPGDDPSHPLARYGQTLDVQVIVIAAVSRTHYETRIGRYVIQSWDEQEDGAVSVEAVGVLQAAADDRLVESTVPRAGGTLASEFARLLPPRLSVDISSALVDRACPQTMEWSEDRLAALYDIVDAWPARLRTAVTGQLTLLAPLPATPVAVLTFSDGENGTIVSAPRTDTRDGVYNRVVARADASNSGTTTPGSVLQSIADQTTGPMSTLGPYGIVTRFYSSPLITSQAEADAAAKTMLASSLLPSRTIPVEIVPDPRIEVDDAIRVRRGDDEWTGFVVSYDLPLTIQDGAMRLDVGIVDPIDAELVTEVFRRE